MANARQGPRELAGGTENVNKDFSSEFSHVTQAYSRNIPKFPGRPLKVGGTSTVHLHFATLIFPSLPLFGIVCTST